ncbi:uncharacterized protein [Centruroides vittatus]|uniref:uncharacterized protein n=1 Tax=Centruroides vittatus TaxID=120091 RepID=UPI00350F4423
MRNIIIYLILIVNVFKFCTSFAPRNISFNEENSWKFKELEDFFKNSKDQITKFIYPYLIRIYNEVNITSLCRITGIKLFAGFKFSKNWTFKMFDAMSKPVPALEYLSLWQYGNYDQCLNLVVPKNEEMPITVKNELFRGKYCVLKVEGIPLIMIYSKKPKKNQEFANSVGEIEQEFKFIFTTPDLKYFQKNFEFRMDLCIPSTCSQNDLTSIIQWIIQDKVQWYVDYCTVKTEVFEYTSRQVICLIFFGFCITCVLLSTALHVIFSLLPEKLRLVKKVKMLRKFSSISIFESLEKLLNIKQGNKLHWLCGMKVSLLYGIVFGHCFYCCFIYPTAFSNLMNFPTMFRQIFYYTISSIPISIEYFLFISAFVNYWQKFIHGKKMKVDYLLFFFKTYFRLTIPVLVTMSFQIIMPLFGEGPHWKEIIEETSRKCENEWWQFLIHINNVFMKERTCLPHLWFIAVLMQLSLVSMIIIVILIRWPKLGIILLLLLIFVGTASNAMYFILSKNYYIPGFPKLNEYRKIKSFILDNYVLPYYSHLSSYSLGLLTGYFLAKHETLIFRKRTLCLWWIGIIAMMWYSYFGLYYYMNDIPTNDSVIIVYHSLYRLITCVALSLFCICCFYGYAGIFKRFFSYNVFVILDRINVWVYLLHYEVIQYVLGKTRNPIPVNGVNMWMFYTFVLVLSIVLSLLFYIFLQPVVEKIVFSVMTLCTLSRKESSTKNDNPVIQTITSNITHL